MQEPLKKRQGFKSYKPTYKTAPYIKHSQSKPKFQKFPENRYFKNVNAERGQNYRASINSQPTPKFHQKNEYKKNYLKPDHSSNLSNIDKTSQSTAESYIYTRPKYNPESTCRHYEKIAVAEIQPKPDFSKHSPSIRKKINDVVHPKFTSHPMHPKHKQLTNSSTSSEKGLFSKRKQHTSHFGFRRVFGKDGRNFFANCEDDCACLEAIFGKGDAEMKEDTSEAVSESSLSQENSMQQTPSEATMSELVFEENGYEVVCLVENDTPDFEQESKNEGECSPSNSFNTTSGSFYSMKEQEDLTDEPYEGYEVESEPAQTHFADFNLRY